jgi:hypothetical protein
MDLRIYPEDLSRCIEMLTALGYHEIARPMSFTSGRVQIHRLRRVEGEDFLVVRLLLAEDTRSGTCLIVGFPSRVADTDSGSCRSKD